MKESLASWYKVKPATAKEISDFERRSYLRLPKDYRNFLLQTNGGEGSVGELYLSAWSIKELEDLNVSYGVRDRLGASRLGIANDGDYCLALDYSGITMYPSLIGFPLGGIDEAEIVLIGRDYCTGIMSIAAGEFTSKDFYHTDSPT